MTIPSIQFDILLGLPTRQQLRDALAMTAMVPSIVQANQLTDHARALQPGHDSLRLAVVHTYTSDLLDPWLALAAALEGMTISTYHAPYGFAVDQANADSELVRHEPDATVLMLRRTDLHPDFFKPLVALDLAQQQMLADESLARLRQIVRIFRAQRVGQLVLTLLPEHRPLSLGLFDAQAERSEADWWNRFKQSVGSFLRESASSSLLLDLDEVAHDIGRSSFFDRRFLYSAQYPFSAAGAWHTARRFVVIGVVLKRPKAKVIVLDADNTLWGGIIGEDGLHGIAVGPDYPGNAFLDFQRRLLDFQQRGFVLALCSKNNPEDVTQVLQDHPHQLLRESHFAAIRVNWLSKEQNLRSLAEELNLGLDSLVFVDDSDHECAAIRLNLPQVEVIQTPSKPVDVPRCLDHVPRLEVLTLTAEDRAKADMYAHERLRRALQSDVDQRLGDPAEYLAMLKMRMRISVNVTDHVIRLSQLTQKTNQFNLTTRRYSEQELRDRLADDRWLVVDFSLSDIFGDSGIVGLAMFRLESPSSAELDNFLMSCRVIGRSADRAFLNAVLCHLSSTGVDNVAATFIPTKKNSLVKDFLSENGFDNCGNGRFVRSLLKDPPAPATVFPVDVEWGCYVTGAARGLNIL